MGILFVAGLAKVVAEATCGSARLWAFMLELGVISTGGRAAIARRGRVALILRMLASATRAKTIGGGGSARIA
jgi:hypothetical protein